MEKSLKTDGPIAGLQMVGLLATLIFLISCSFEVLALHDLHRPQHFLIALLHAALSLWAITEVWLLGRTRRSMPLGHLKILLGLQLLLGVMRHLPWSPMPQLATNAALSGGSSDLRVTTFLILGYLLLFIAISKLLINAFSHAEYIRAEQLALQIHLNEQTLKDLRKARDDAEAAARALADANLELSRLATTDHLTDAHNRRSLEKAVQQEIERLHRYGESSCVILLDLDYFKSINDNFSHEAGDKVLIELSRRVREEVRKIDMLARMGGEEFVVLLPYSDKDQALAVAEKLRRRIAMQDFTGVGQVTSSFGVTQLQHEDTLDTLLQRADQALYDAKRTGRNRVCVR